jgi:hypothetical protein
MLEEEVYSQNSPIWDQDFLSASSRTSPLGIQTGTSLLYKLESNQEAQARVLVVVLRLFVCHKEIDV